MSENCSRSIVYAGSSYLPLDCIRKLVASWNALDDDVFLLDTGIEQFPLCSIDESIDDLYIPSCVNNADAKGRA